MPLKTGESTSDKRDIENKQLYLQLINEDIPLWCIADIIHQTNKLKPENKKSSRKIDLKNYVEDFDYKDLDSNDEIEQNIKKILKLRENKIPFWAISDITELPLKNIIYSTRVINSQVCGKPWQEEKTLKKLYLEENRYFTEISEIFGCHQETVRTSVDENNISKVDSSERTSSKKVTKLQRTELPDTEKLIDGSVPIEDVINDKINDLL